jgi:uncharacterized HAD superfamily protein
MKKKKVFGLDFDDVLMDFYPSLCLFHNENYGTSLSKEDVHSYYIQDIFGCTTEEAMERVWNFYHSTKHHDAKPVSGAMEALQVLEEEYDLHIITARPESVREVTESWINTHFPKMFKGIHFTNQFFGVTKKTTKAEVAQKEGVTFFIDDAPHHAEEVAEIAEQVFLFDAPWNNTHATSKENITRVTSWPEVLQFLPGFLEGKDF